MQLRDVLFVLAAYLSGSVLFARVSGWLFCRRDVTADSQDQNPGTANAFLRGGFRCGLLTLCGDLLKGFLPVFLYLHGPGANGAPALALVLAAPVIGHVYPLFFRFRGGKGIAASFGCLLGLLPGLRPFWTLALVFLLFTLVLRVTPNYYKTLVTYSVSALTMVLSRGDPAVTVGFCLMALTIILRLLRSTEEKAAFHMEVAWKR